MRAAGALCGGTRAALGGIITCSEGSVSEVQLLPWYHWRKSSRGFMARDGREGKGETLGGMSQRGCYMPKWQFWGAYDKGVSDTKRSKQPCRGDHQPLHLHPCQLLPGHLSPPERTLSLGQPLPALTKQVSKRGVLWGSNGPPSSAALPRQWHAPGDSEGMLEPPPVSMASLVLLILPAPASLQPKAEPLSVLLYQSILHGQGDDHH